MPSTTEYRDRLADAMKVCGMNAHALAARVGISYQAVMKVLAGTSKALTAANNSIAAQAMGVDTDWLATGEGVARPPPRTWPFSCDLLAAARLADARTLRQAENAARVALNLDALPRAE
jgi:transcriptional regulator with XRE-family HTH domain